MMRKLILLTAFAGASLFAAPAMAQIPIPGLYTSRLPAGDAPVLGNVIRGSSDSTFSISTTGVVTRLSGDAVRVTSGSVIPPVITVTCVGVVLCLLADTRITVTASGNSNEARITKFRMGSLTNASFRTGPPVEGASLVFDLQPFGYASATFTLGMDVLVPSNSTPGNETYSYTVTATRP